MFIEPTITWVPSGFSGYIWFDTKIVLKKRKENLMYTLSPVFGSTPSSNDLEESGNKWRVIQRNCRKHASICIHIYLLPTQVEFKIQ